LIDLWNTLGTPPVANRTAGPYGPAEAGVHLPSLQTTLSSLGVTKFRLRQLEAVTLIREERENGKQQLAYNAQPFVLCGIPLRRPPRTQLVHSRRNGRFFLDITGHPDYEPEHSDNNEAAENVISLSEAFYKEIDQHRIPVEREVIAALAHAPGMIPHPPNDD
jgi:hypothetical protein